MWMISICLPNKLAKEALGVGFFFREKYAFSKIKILSYVSSLIESVLPVVGGNVFRL